MPPCVAEPIDADAGAVVRTNREGEWTFFRCVLAPPTPPAAAARPRRVLSLRLRPQTDAASGEPIGDADLYVSNARRGVGAVGRDNYVWKATAVGAVRIDIHPDDPRAAAGDTYVIGVLGCARAPLLGSGGRERGPRLVFARRASLWRLEVRYPRATRRRADG